MKTLALLGTTMNRERVRLLVACLAATAAAPLLGTEAASDRVDAFVRGYIARRNIPAAAVAVVQGGKIVKAGGYGLANLEWRVPASERTVFEIGSISKQFTAEAVMILVEEGRLGLDDPIRRHLPEAPASWAGITVRHLLTHTSGLHDWEAAGDLSYRREYTVAEFIELLDRHPLDFRPGERWSYTNSAFPLLGIIVQRASGQDYEAFVTGRVFKKAAMTDTRFKHPEDVVPFRAAGYVDRGGLLVNGEPLRPRIIAPNGGILTTAIDMAKWQIALDAGGIVKPATLAEMLRPIDLGGRPFSAGIAWFFDTFRGHPMALHNGSTIAGFSSVIYRFPKDGLSVVALMNIDRFNDVNVIATRVGGLFVPGLSIFDLPEARDPDPALTRRFVSMLNDVAEDRDSEMLAPHYRNPGKAPRVGRDMGFKGEPDRVAFLEREDLGPTGEDKFGVVIRTIYRYKFTKGDRVTYFSLELDADGKVARFFPEQG